MTAFLLVCLFGIVEIRFVRADTIIVNNSSIIKTKTSVSAESGGSTSSNGGDGVSSASVTSQTVVNGELVESFEETVTGASGAEARIQYEKTYATSSSSGSVRVSNGVQRGEEVTSGTVVQGRTASVTSSALQTANATSGALLSTASTAVSIGSSTDITSSASVRSLWSRMWTRASSLLRSFFIF